MTCGEYIAKNFFHLYINFFLLLFNIIFIKLFKQKLYIVNTKKKKNTFQDLIRALTYSLIASGWKNFFKYHKSSH